MMKHIDVKTIGELQEITFTQGNITVVCLNFGARLYKIFTPDRNGKRANILLAHDDYRDVLNDQACFGATIGPVAGRITDSKWHHSAFQQNKHQVLLHSGSQGWQHQYWQTEIINNNEFIGVKFSYQDKGESGFVGNISAHVYYLLNNDNDLEVIYEGSAVSETVFNPTNHAYFNLSGKHDETIEQHCLWINSQHYLKVDENKVPTGEVCSVKGSPYDFTQPQLLANVLSKLANGLDDTFVLNGEKNQARLRLSHENSGRELTLYTDRAAIVIFSTTNMNESYFVNGQKMVSQLGLAIEPQEHPDAIHHAHFPSITLAPEAKRTLRTRYRFN